MSRRAPCRRRGRAVPGWWVRPSSSRPQGFIGSGSTACGRPERSGSARSDRPGPLVRTSPLASGCCTKPSCESWSALPERGARMTWPSDIATNIRDQRRGLADYRRGGPRCVPGRIAGQHRRGRQTPDRPAAARRLAQRLPTAAEPSVPPDGARRDPSLLARCRARLCSARETRYCLNSVWRLVRAVTCRVARRHRR